MLSSSVTSVEKGGSSPTYSSRSTDGNTGIGEIRGKISRKQVHETLTDGHDKAGTDQSSPDSSCPEYTPELATKLLQQFGLEKEDMGNLLSYPEEQVTVMNLPLILKQICDLKEKKTVDGSNFPPRASTSGSDGMSSEGPQIHQVKPKEDKFSGREVLEGTHRRVEGGLSYNHRKEILWRGKTQGKNSCSVPSQDQKSSSTSLSSIQTSVDCPPSDSSKPQTQPGQGLQTIISLFPLLNQGTDRSSGKSHGSEPSLTKTKSTPDNQPSASLLDDMNPGRADRFLSGQMCKDESTSHGRVITVVETKRNQKRMKQKTKQKSQEEQYQRLERPVPEMQKTQGYSVPPPSVRPRTVSASLRPPQALSNPITQWLQPPPGGPFLPEVSVFSGLPPPAMMEDYAAATPRAFPHTCSLCCKVCADIKDWISHQNVSFHLENCKILRKRYPNWASTLPLFKSLSDVDGKQRASTSSQTSQQYDHRVRLQNRPRSRSSSPYSCSRPMEEGSRSRSRSPGPYPYDALRRRSKSGELADSNAHGSPSRGRSQEKRSSSSRRTKKGSSSRGVHKRQGGSSHKHQRSSKVDKLSRKLLKTSAVQSLMKSPKLKAVIKRLVPVILAELGKLKSSAAPSSSSAHAANRRLDATSSRMEPDVHTTESAPKAVVRFENEEEAEKVKQTRSLDIEGTSAVKEKNVLPRKRFPTEQKQKMAPQQISVQAGVSKRRPAERSSSAALRLPPTRKPSSSTRRKSTTASRLVSKAKVLVSKARNVLNLQVFRPLKMGAVKLAKGKRRASKLPRSTRWFSRRRADRQKIRPEKNKTGARKSPNASEETRQKSTTPVGCLQEDVDVSREGMEENEDVMKSLHAGSDSPHDAAEAAPESEQQAEPDEASLWTKAFKDAETWECVESGAADQREGKTEDKPERQTPTTAAGSSSQSQKHQTSAQEAEQKAGSSSASQTPEMLTAVATKTKKKVRKKNRSGGDPADQTMPSAAADVLTAEENLTSLCGERISCLGKKTVMSSKLFSLDAKVLLITNLPKYSEGCYREDEVANLLRPFGFIYKGNNIYVIPEKCMAFAQMPDVKTVQNIVAHSDQNNLVFRGSKLSVRVVHDMLSMTPFGFYSFLIKRSHSKVEDDGGSSVFIHNISESEASALREALKTMGSVRRYLPLLNKVFVEFKSRSEADRLGVWYSLLKHPPAHYVFRMKIPQISRISPPPKAPNKAVPDGGRAGDGAAAPAAECWVPHGSTPPFWITMTTKPFLFPTFSPWFSIPEHLTVGTIMDVKKTAWQASKFNTIMLTGLPQRNYTHEDVAKLVWRHFPLRNLRTLFYNVTVLALQRRAFVFFISWDACQDFLLNHVNNPVSVEGANLSVHLVLENMQPGVSEETMYRALMRWSDAHVSEPESLEERLLCVEICRPDVHLVLMVMKEVASVAAFVNFLPLANRIVVEMAEPRGVTEVVDKISLDSSCQIWRRVKRIEPLKSLNRRLQDSSETEINLEVDTLGGSQRPAEDLLNPAARSDSPPWCGGEMESLFSPQRISWPRQRGKRASESPVASMESPWWDGEGGKPTENVAASRSESEQKPEASEKDPSPKRRKLELKHQTQSLEAGFKDATVKDEKKGVEEHGEDEKSHPAEEEKLNALHKSEGKQEDEEDQVLRQGGLQVSDVCVTSADDRTGPELQPLETPCYLLSEADGSPTGDVYQAMDSVEGQPPTERGSETNEGKAAKRSTAAASRDDEPTRTNTSERDEMDATEETLGGHEDASETRSSRGPKSAGGSSIQAELLLCAKEAAEPTNTGSANRRTAAGDVWSRSRTPEMPASTSPSAGDSEDQREEKTPLKETCPARKSDTLTVDEIKVWHKNAEEQKTTKHVTEDRSRPGGNDVAIDGTKMAENGDERRAPTNSSCTSKSAGEEEDTKWKTENKETDASLCEVGEDETVEGRRTEESWWWDVTEGKLLTWDEAEEEDDGYEEGETPGSAEGREGCSERRSVLSKHTRGLVGPQAKLRHFQSSFLSVDAKLFPFSGRPPLGEEFVEPRSGLFCSVCCVFFLDEPRADDAHCCSRAHYDNLQRYYQRLSRRPDPS
ncbi:uncharacterized protein LOC105935958 [Fundulus heteroclitus]|uniref:uncharacterized protein LOC105935958 n=1 Tax=Fundulus heteroclitus TaxID=8078 RepID=UPI00165C0C14|nr:uncharacterized protein LOC105935958 [Fundulus heteroclitus]